ncbi:MAG: hypothetical protein CML06_04190 [Pseudomonadales bacterium]|nr:hypothetical protein [Pseudomonadales bacterium]
MMAVGLDKVPERLKHLISPVRHPGSGIRFKQSRQLWVLAPAITCRQRRPSGDHCCIGGVITQGHAQSGDNL